MAETASRAADARLAAAMAGAQEGLKGALEAADAAAIAAAEAVTAAASDAAAALRAHTEQMIMQARQTDAAERATKVALAELREAETGEGARNRVPCLGVILHTLVLSSQREEALSVASLLSCRGEAPASSLWPSLCAPAQAIVNRLSSSLTDICVCVITCLRFLSPATARSFGFPPGVWPGFRTGPCR